MPRCDVATPPLPSAIGRWHHLQLIEHLLCEFFKVLHPSGRKKLGDEKGSLGSYISLLEETESCFQKALAMHQFLAATK